MKNWMNAEWRRDGRTVYALGDGGTNLFSASVQASGSERISDKEAEDVARMMRAAPELREALRVARNSIYHGEWEMGWSISRLDEVLAKAVEPTP